VVFTYDPDRDLKPGETVVITATFNRPVGEAPTISIDTPGADTGSVEMVATSDGKVWTYSYVVPEGSDGTATVTVSGVKDGSGGTKNNTIEIDGTGPSVALTYEPGGTVKAGETMVITATFDEEIEGIPTISIDTPGVDLSDVEMTKSEDAKVWTYSYVLPAGSDGQAIVTISGVEDEAGNTSQTATNNTFEIGPSELGVELSYEPKKEIVPGTTVVITATFDGTFTGTPSVSVDTLGPDVGPLVMTQSEDGLVWTFSYVVPEGSEGEATVNITGITGSTSGLPVNLTNNTFTINKNEADVSVSVAAGSESVVRRGELTYTVTISNRGPMSAAGVKLVNELPTNASLKSVGPESLNCNLADGSVTCELETMAAEAEEIATIVVTVDADADGDLVNRATASSSVTDPDQTNNESVTETPVVVGVLSYVVSIVEGDIDATGIVLTDSPDPVFLGNDLTYDLDVSNNGEGSVTDVNLIVTLPGSVAFASAIIDFEASSSSARLGTTAVFASSPKVAQLLSNLDAPLFANVGECTEGSGTVICALGTLESG